LCQAPARSPEPAPAPSPPSTRVDLSCDGPAAGLIAEAGHAADRRALSAARLHRALSSLHAQQVRFNV
ncbi:MAG: hypothetical protein ACREIV_13925, partial [Planctomycetaceae bacterium]